MLLLSQVIGHRTPQRNAKDESPQPIEIGKTVSRTQRRLANQPASIRFFHGGDDMSRSQRSNASTYSIAQGDHHRIAARDSVAEPVVVDGDIRDDDSQIGVLHR